MVKITSVSLQTNNFFGQSNLINKLVCFRLMLSDISLFLNFCVQHQRRKRRQAMSEDEENDNKFVCENHRRYMYKYHQL